ncbi:MAG: hypothetical protein COU72_05305 [Parcubacteria group bacterium CG10_big_fil_rev_8_21_14_0_10_41_35]|nr:MAG: hypothetical protein COU72_05305 [Parcubacteria group bacterium CG10_big_fil_rev_8_21_14_0_10_41_35]
MDALIFLYIFGWALFIFILYTFEPRGYYWGRIRGYLAGPNNPEKTKEMIHQDIGRARKEVLVASCTADMSYWDEGVIKKIEVKASEKDGVRFTFVVGPEFNNVLLQNLAEANENVSLRILKEIPPCDFRIMDRNGTYTSNHGCEGASRRFFRTFGNIKAVQDRLEMFKQLYKQSSEYRRSA